MASTTDRLLRKLRLKPQPAKRAPGPAREEASIRAADAEAVIDAFPRDGAPIRPITGAEFAELTRTYPYYERRWKYTSIALAQAAGLIRDRQLATALELGVHIQPVIVGADALDITARPELRDDVHMTVHDATIRPWPFDDKQYDLFMGLQVFEHLKDQQPQAFLEVRRIARHAIISLPIDWVKKDPNNCHHQISEERVLSWFAPIVPTRVVEGSGGRFRRLVFVFEDLPAPG